MGSIVREKVLQAGVLQIGTFQHAADAPGVKKSNNKLEFRRLFDNDEALRTVVQYLGKVARKYQPDALLGVPTGGTDLCHALNDCASTPLPLIELVKLENDDSQIKKFELKNLDDQDRLDSATRILIVEDVFNSFASTRGVLTVEGVAQKAVGAIAVWDRGFHPSRIPLEVDHEALVSEFIPRYLRSGEELYLRAEHVL